MTVSVYWLIGVVAVLSVIGIAYRAMRMPKIYLSDIPRLFHATLAGREDATFAVMVLETVPAGQDGACANIQFSIEEGRIGLDWVLLADVNIAHQKRFERLVSTQGYSPVILEMNEVRYVRVEGAGLDRLCQTVLTEMFGITETDPLSLILDGVKWP